MYHCHNSIVTKVKDNFVWKDLTASIPIVTLPPTNKCGKISLCNFLTVLPSYDCLQSLAF